jgi:hypothetical protein
MAGPVTGGRGVRRWPLVLIASPAAVSIWSGWVGLGSLAGFGPVHPLPGIAPGFVLNTAITLPIGVEAYGAYALGAWLAPGVRAAARRFARRSAVGALALGMAGQVIYHLLAAARATAAPWPVTMIVSCMPVITLGFGAALTHLLRHPATEPAATATARTGEPPLTASAARTGSAAAPGRHAGRTADTLRPAASHAAVQPGGSPAAIGPARQGSDRSPARLDRVALVAELAGEIRAAEAEGREWRPDYSALMTRTGYRRSWCEKAVRSARSQAAEDGPDAARPGATRTAPLGARTGHRSSMEPDAA